MYVKNYDVVILAVAAANICAVASKYNLLICITKIRLKRLSHYAEAGATSAVCQQETACFFIGSFYSDQLSIFSKSGEKFIELRFSIFDF